MIGKAGDPDTESQFHSLPRTDLEYVPLDTLPDSFRDLEGIPVRTPPEKNRELITTVTSQGVDFPHVLLEYPHESPKGLGPDEVPIAIVDALETIQVQEEKRKVGPVTVRPADFGIDGAQEVARVVDLGDVIDER